MSYRDLEIGDDGLARCGWVGSDPLYIDYHDREWGVELRGDTQLFEKLTLEAFQAGLSWITILRRREHFREAFAGFSLSAVAAFTDDDVERLMNNTGIIRNRAKITATLVNARILHEFTQRRPGALTDLLWSFQPALPKAKYSLLRNVPSHTTESEQMSATLKQMGLRFVGPTTMYALMQSTGMVDDHLVGCHRSAQD